MDETLDWQKVGRRNANRGKAFERLCADRSTKLGLNLIFKWIDRTYRRGVSLCDIECVDFPGLKMDCKFTEGEFTYKEKVQLLQEAIQKYGDGAVIVVGEKKGRTKLSFDNVLVVMYTPLYRRNTLVLIHYDEFLFMLANYKKENTNGYVSPSSH